MKQLDVSMLKKIDSPGGKFKRIVVKAFIKEGVKQLDDIHECMKWAVGEAYAYLPFQHWGKEIMERHKEIRFPPFVPIYVVMRAVARLWRKERKIYAFR